MGDPEQIDHPYLDSASNGLTYVVERFKQEGISGHIMLEKGSGPNWLNWRRICYKFKRIYFPENIEKDRLAGAGLFAELFKKSYCTDLCILLVCKISKICFWQDRTGVLLFVTINFTGKI